MSETFFEKAQAARQAKYNKDFRGPGRDRSRPGINQPKDSAGAPIIGQWVHARKVKGGNGPWEWIPVKKWQAMTVAEQSSYNVMRGSEQGNAYQLRDHPAVQCSRPVKVHRSL
jgi:hypothetical protein